HNRVEVHMEIYIILQHHTTLYVFFHHHLIQPDMTHGTAYFAHAEIVTTRLTGKGKVNMLQLSITQRFTIDCIEKCKFKAKMLHLFNKHCSPILTSRKTNDKYRNHNALSFTFISDEYQTNIILKT